MNGRVASTVVEIAANLDLSRDTAVALSEPLAVSSYETRKWRYMLAIPLLGVLTLWVMAKKKLRQLFKQPKLNTNTLWFDGISPGLRLVKERAKSWRALDVIYNWRFGQKSGLFCPLEDFWFGIMNAQSVRNRLKLIKLEIQRAILECGNHQEVRILSLAAGSSQGIIEVMADFKRRGIKTRALLLDIDPTALVYARKLARKGGVSEQITVVNTSVAQVRRVSQRFRPQIIEMLGLLDYIPEEKAIRLVSKIRESFEPGGIFLTCNIRRNPERHFMKWVVDWPMIYRDPRDMARIITKAGFVDYRLIYEPLKIHGLIVARLVPKA